MAFERTVYASMMPSTVQRSTRSGHSNYGSPTYSTTITRIRARVVAKPGFVRNQTGEDVAFHTVAWLASTGTLDISDRYQLPDGTAPPVVNLERYPDEDGTYYHKLFFGW